MSGEEKMLPVSVVARRLGCSVSNVYNLIAAGRLVALRRGVKKGYAVRERDVEVFLRSGFETGK